jgi:hypothetical protein
MNRLEKWSKDGVIYIYATDVIQKEAEKGGDTLGRKAWSRVGLVTPPLSADDWKLWNEIAAIVFPRGVLTDSQRNDVQTLYTTKKFGAILVTNDGGSKSQPGGILGHAKELWEKLRIRVMRDSEAVNMVGEEIAERDARERRMAVLKRRPLAE